MGWTTPATWVAGQLVSAAGMNVQVRDNLNYLLAPNAFFVQSAAGALSTTSTTYASLGTAWARSITMNGGYLRAGAQMVISGVASTSGVVFLGVDIDGTTYTAQAIRASGNNMIGVSISKFFTGIAAGAHTVTLKWRVSGGDITGSIDPTVMPLEFWAVET